MRLREAVWNNDVQNIRSRNNLTSEVASGVLKIELKGAEVVS